MSNTIKQLMDAQGNAFDPKTSIEALTTPSTGGAGNFLTTKDIDGKIKVVDTDISLEDVFQTVTVGQTTTGEPGTNAEVVNSGTGANAVLDFTIPRGNDGHNPNLGTYKIVNGTITPTPPTPNEAGDFITVLDETDPSNVTGTIYKWDSTLSTPAWVSTGRDSNMAYFGSGELLSDVHIDDTHLVNPQNGALPKAEDVLQLKAKLEGVTASEVKASYTIIDGYYINYDGSLREYSSGHYTVIPINGATKVRFLGYEIGSQSGNNYSYAFWNNPTYVDSSTVVSSSYYDVKSGETSMPKEYVVDVPDGATYIAITIASINVPNFYCYLQSGESVVDLISDLQYQIDYIGYNVENVTNTENIKRDYYIRYSDGARISGSLASNFSIRWYNCQNVDRVKVYVGSDTTLIAFIAFYSSDVNPNTSTFGTYMQESSIQSNSTTGWFEAEIPSGAKYVAISNKGIVCQEPKVLLLTKSEDSTFVEQDDFIPVAEEAAKIQYVNSVDLSLLIPTGGANGSNRYNLETALNVVPEEYQKGGLTIKFIDSVTTNYVEYHLIKSTWSTDVNDWETISDTLKQGNYIASTNSVIGELYGTEEHITEISVDVTQDVATNAYININLKHNTDYMMVFSNKNPSNLNLYSSVLFYNKSNVIPVYVNGSATTTTSVISTNQADRYIKLINLTVDSTRVRIQKPADYNNVNGVIKIKFIELTNKKGLANIDKHSVISCADSAKKEIQSERPYYFDDTFSNVNSYIDPSYLDERIKAVPEGKHFIFNTDTHIDYGRTYDTEGIGYGNLQKETPIMKYVKDKLGIKNVVFGGDCIGGVRSKYQAAKILSIYCDDKFNAFGSDFLYCQGNHDANAPMIGKTVDGTVVTKEEALIPDSEIYKRTTRYMKEYGKAVFDNVMLNAIENEDFSSYVDPVTGLDTMGYTASELKEELKAWAMLHYYYDDDVQKIRYIVMETDDASHAYRTLIGTGVHMGLDFTNDFVANALLSIPKDYDVVIVGHEFDYPVDNTHDYTTNGELNAWIHFYMLMDAYQKKSFVKYRMRVVGSSSLKQCALNIMPKLVYMEDGYDSPLNTRGSYRVYDFKNVKGSGRVFSCSGHYHANDCEIISFSGSGSNLRVSYTEYDGTTFPETNYFMDIKFDRAVLNGRSSSYINNSNHPLSTSYPNDSSYDISTTPTEQRLGTVKEVLFDVVTITADNRIVCTRFGAGGTGDSGIESQGNREFRLFAPEQSNN